MRIAEKRDAIRRQTDDLVHGVREGIRSLVRQSVDQIHINAVEAECASRLNEIARYFVRLDAVNGLLYRLVEILNAHTEAIETEAPQSFQMFARGDTGVDFDAYFGVRRKCESLFGIGKKIFELRGGRIGGGAAAPMELHDLAIARDGLCYTGDFFLQNVEIWKGNAFVFLDDDVAGAKKTEALAKGQMHVKGNGSARGVGGRVDFLQIGGAKSIVPNGGGGIAGVAWARPIVASEEFFADAEFAFGLVETGLRNGHSAAFALYSSRRLSAVPRWLRNLEFEDNASDEIAAVLVIGDFRGVAAEKRVAILCQGGIGIRRHVTRVAAQRDVPAEFILHATAEAVGKVRARRITTTVEFMGEAEASSGVGAEAVVHPEKHVQQSELVLVDGRIVSFEKRLARKNLRAVGGEVAVPHEFGLGILRQRMVNEGAKTGGAVDA